MADNTEMDVNGMIQSISQRRLNEKVPFQDLLDDVLKVFDLNEIQEFYEHILKRNLEFVQSKRYPPGGVTISVACLLYIRWLQTGDTMKVFEEKYHQSDSSMSRLIVWMTERVNF